MKYAYYCIRFELNWRDSPSFHSHNAFFLTESVAMSAVDLTWKTHDVQHGRGAAHWSMCETTNTSVIAHDGTRYGWINLLRGSRAAERPPPPSPHTVLCVLCTLSPLSSQAPTKGWSCSHRTKTRSWEKLRGSSELRGPAEADHSLWVHHDKPHPSHYRWPFDPLFV